MNLKKSWILLDNLALMVIKQDSKLLLIFLIFFYISKILKIL